MWRETAEIESRPDTDEGSRVPEVHYHSVQNRRLMIIPSQGQNHPYSIRKQKSYHLKVQNTIRKLVEINIIMQD